MESKKYGKEEQKNEFFPVCRSAKDNNFIIKREVISNKSLLDDAGLLSSKSLTLDVLYRKNKEKELLQSIANYESTTIEKIHIAENIDFKSLPDSIINTDEYGFVLDNNSSVLSSLATTITPLVSLSIR